MSKWNDFTQKVKDAGASVANGSKSVYDKTSLNVKIKNLEAKLAEQYEKYGRYMYVELKKPGAKAEDAKAVAGEIDVLRAEVKELKAQKEAIEAAEEEAKAAKKAEKEAKKAEKEAAKAAEKAAEDAEKVASADLTDVSDV